MISVHSFVFSDFFLTCFFLQFEKLSRTSILLSEPFFFQEFEVEDILRYKKHEDGSEKPWPVICSVNSGRMHRMHEPRVLGL